MLGVKDKNIPNYGVLALNEWENCLLNAHRQGTRQLRITENLLVKSEINVNKSIRLQVDTG